MDATKDFITAVWENLDGWLMFFNISSGILLGILAGLVLAIWLQRRGWLGRVNRAHHLLLKLYFLALPCAGGFVGMQAGVVYAMEKQIHREIDRQQPYVETIAHSIASGFQQYLENSGNYDLANYVSLTPREGLLLLVDDFIAHTPIQIFENSQDLSLRQRWIQNSLERSRRALLVWLLDEVLIPVIQDTGSSYTRLSADTIKQITDAPINTWFDARAILDFSKDQVSRIWFSYYLAIAAQWLLVMMLIALEFGLSRYFGQLRRDYLDPAVPASSLPAG